MYIGSFVNLRELSFLSHFSYVERTFYMKYVDLSQKRAHLLDLINN